jgi:hypothetical protein
MHVGAVDGSTLGLVVGWLLVGWDVGLVEGFFDGEQLGVYVGVVEGTKDGLTVG